MGLSRAGEAEDCGNSGEILDEELLPVVHLRSLTILLVRSRYSL